MKLKFLSCGEIIWDVYDGEKTLGGAPLNFAMHSARCGAESYILSAVGADELGTLARDEITRAGVRSDMLSTSARPTGVCNVTLDACGVPEYKVSADAAYDRLCLSERDVERIAALEFDALYFGTLIQRATPSREALRFLCERVKFKNVICDVNLRNGCYDADSAAFCLRNATILKISDEEEPRLREMELYHSSDASPEAIAKSICQSYPNVRIVLLTMGERGAVAYSEKEKALYFTPAKKTQVVSSVGAGDSFLAAWCTSYLGTEDIRCANERAAALSSFVVSRKQAVPDYSWQDGKLVF